MAMRRLNRNYSSDVYDSSIFDYPDKIKNNLDIADSLYLEYFTNPTCENLSKFLEKWFLNKTTKQNKYVWSNK